MTRQEHAQQSSPHFWRLTPNADQLLESRLVAAMTDRGEGGSMSKVWAYSKDHKKVQLISPFKLDDQEKDALRVYVSRVRIKNLKSWAMFVSPGMFDKGIEAPDYTRCVHKNAETFIPGRPL